MSRSYKKSPVVTCEKDKAMKKLYNRKIRHSKIGNPYKDYKKRNQSWNICDYAYYETKSESEWDEEDYKAYRRK